MHTCRVAETRTRGEAEGSALDTYDAVNVSIMLECHLLLLKIPHIGQHAKGYAKSEDF